MPRSLPSRTGAGERTTMPGPGIGGAPRIHLGSAVLGSAVVSIESARSPVGAASACAGPADAPELAPAEGAELDTEPSGETSPERDSPDARAAVVDGGLIGKIGRA